MKKVRWYQKILCRAASYIIKKYDVHHLSTKSKILLDNKVYYITAYQHTDRIDEFPSISLEGVSPISDLKSK